MQIDEVINAVKGGALSRDEIVVALEKCKGLIYDSVEGEDNPCRLDHTGFCQEHCTDGYPCRIAVGREFLGLPHSDIIVRA